MRRPRTQKEWQEAVDAAEACLLIDSARQYGLVTGGPEINVERAVQFLADGRTLGIHPRPDAIELFLSRLAQTKEAR